MSERDTPKTDPEIFDKDYFKSYTPEERKQYDHFWLKGNHSYVKVNDRHIKIIPNIKTGAHCNEKILRFASGEIGFRDASGKRFQYPDIDICPDGKGGIDIFIKTKDLTGPFVEIIEPLSVNRGDDDDINLEFHSSPFIFIKTESVFPAPNCEKYVFVDTTAMQKNQKPN